MKTGLLVIFIFASLVPFVSPVWGVSLNDAHDRYLDKRDMNFGQRRESEDVIQEKTEEAESGTEDAQSRLQELSDERDQRIEEDERVFEEAYEAQKDVIRNVGK